jgi:hypothetical protein
VVLVGAGVGIALALPGHSTSSVNHPKTPTPLAYHGISLAATAKENGYSFDSSSFSPDGKLLAAYCFNSNTVDAKYFVWDDTTHQQVASLSLPQYSTGVNNPVISADDKSLIAITSPSTGGSGNNNPLQVLSWDISTGTRTTVLSVTSPESQFIGALDTTSISGDGRTLAIEDPGRDGIYLYNLQTGARIADLTETDMSAITGVSLDNNGDKVDISHQSGFSFVRATSGGKLLATFHYNDKSTVKDITALPPVLSPDGATVLIYPNGDFTGPDSLWSVATQANITPKSALWPKEDYGGVFSGSGLFVNGNGKNGADIWDVATGKHLFTIVYPGHVTGQDPGAISNDGRQLATANLSAAGTAYLWDLH